MRESAGAQKTPAAVREEGSEHAEDARLLRGRLNTCRSPLNGGLDANIGSF